jgi:hypothetical protein
LNELTFFEERDEALFVAYKNALRQPDVKSHQQAIQVAISSPTSQFWIEPYRAYLEILWRKRNRRPHQISATRKILVDDLYNEYLKLKEQPLFRGCSTYFISQFAACRPAKGFYISELTATRIIHRKRHEKIR